MAVRNSKGEYISDDAITRYVLERHNLVLRALLQAVAPGTVEDQANLVTLLEEAAQAIPTIDQQRGRAEVGPDDFARGT
jgi:hypothetical protein